MIIYTVIQKFKNIIPMHQPPPITNPTPTPELSLQFYPQIPQLSQIEQPFPLSTITHQLSTRDLETQFELMRAITETKKHKLRLRTNTVLENKRNRYPEQSVYEFSRVGLGGCRVGADAGDWKKRITNDYINANKITVSSPTNTQTPDSPTLILTQAPLKQTLPDMLSMIIEHSIQCVVMLCNVVENGKNRCYDYLNQGGLYESVERVELEHGWGEAGLEGRRIRVRYGRDGEGGQSQQVYIHQFLHILYTNWPDKSVPQHPSDIHPILQTCLPFKKLLIHCSAGLGRSGVIAALYLILKDIKPQTQTQTQTQNEKQTQNNNQLNTHTQSQSHNKSLSEKAVTVFGTVRRIREYRYGAVQNNQQYQFIYQYLRYYYEQVLGK